MGNERVNTFAPQMSAINDCPHVLRCVVNTFAPQMSAINDCPHVLRCVVNTFAPQMSAINDCPHVLRCVVNTFALQKVSYKRLPACLAVWSAPTGIRRGKTEVSRLLADGYSAPRRKRGRQRRLCKAKCLTPAPRRKRGRRRRLCKAKCLTQGFYTSAYSSKAPLK